jgi:alpha-galactosidase
MSFRQDLPGFGEPTEGCWDGFCRLNTETGSGGLVGVFRHGAVETSRTVTLPWLDFGKTYLVKQGFEGKLIATQSGKELAEKGFSVTLEKKYDGELFEVTASD